jgi:ankyrin repeat protein
MEDAVERVRILIEAGADVNARTNDGLTVLMTTTSSTRVGSTGGQTCELLINSGADVDAKDPKGRTALMFAAPQWGMDIPVLLAHGANINAQDYEGLTPLMHAFDFGTPGEQTIEQLLAGDPDLELRDKEGRTALAHAAFRGGWYGTIVRLIRAGASAQAIGWTHLHIAAAIQEAGLVQMELNQGAPPDPRDQFGRTPLMWSARLGKYEDVTIMRALIRAGADVNAHDLEGDTPLHIVAEHHASLEANTLLDAGANIESRDGCGRTPLMRAAASEHGHFEVELLLKRGADPFAKDNSGHTALDLANREPFQDMRPDSGDLLRKAMNLPPDTAKRW